MTVTGHWFDLGLADVYKKQIDWVNDTINICLCNSSLAPETNRGVYSKYSDVSGDEITGTGYTAGGVALTNKAVNVNTTDHVVELQASDPSWPSATVTAAYAVIYDVTAGNVLLGFVDFGENASAAGVTFTVSFGGTVIEDTAN